MAVKNTVVPINRRNSDTFFLMQDSNIITNTGIINIRFSPYPVLIVLPPINNPFHLGQDFLLKDLNPDKPEITIYKHQITNKFQISISKSQTR
jgi:hypothetical protein